MTLESLYGRRVITLIALACLALDGDTIRCGSDRYRLLAIDAPEMPGHCRTGRDCAPGDPFKSKAALASSLTGKIEVEPINTDRYGRTAAVIYANGFNLSCKQLWGGWARYWQRYDHQRRIWRECRLSSASR